MSKFNAEDCGCHGDGTFGHGYIRSRLAELVDGCENAAIVDRFAVGSSLRGAMPDDAWDEEEALDILNAETAEGYEWTLHEGSVFLSAEGWGSWDAPGEGARKG